jgi:hypothetical protein
VDRSGNARRRYSVTRVAELGEFGGRRQSRPRRSSGGRAANHTHPAYLVYSLSDSAATLIDAEGNCAEVPIKTGDVLWREAEEHAAENHGDRELVALFFEVK